MKNCNQIAANLERKIHVINSESKCVIEEIERGIFHSKKTLRKLRIKILSEGFSTPEDECLFFKTVKIIPKGYLIYYLALSKFEINKPENSEKKVKRYIEHQITKYQKYYKKHQDFYQYLQRNRTDKDKKYFLRSIDHVNFHPDSLTFFIDEDFSTPHDYIAAKFFAHKLLIDRLNKELDSLQKPQQPSAVTPASQLQWTGKKVEFTELIFALQVTGTINNGNMGITEVAQKMAQIFNVKFDGFFQSYRDLNSRKINQTKFLDRLTKNLLRKMADADN